MSSAKLGDGWKTLAEVLDRGKVMIAAEMMGGAQKVLDMTVEYAKVRVQFGRPIGSFQAVQHKCANMMIDVEGAKSAVYYAAWAVSNEVAEASARGGAVPRPLLPTLTGESRPTESRCTAVSASPGTTICICISSAPNRPSSLSATRPIIANWWRRVSICRP